MRIGWLTDLDVMVAGGAEMSADALVKAAPAGVEMLFVPPEEEPSQECDAFLVFNCATYPADTRHYLEGKPIVNRVADYWPHGDADLRAWLLEWAKVTVFSSKGHYDHFPHTVGTKVKLCPAPVDVAEFQRAAGESIHREDMMWMGQMFAHKGLQDAVIWAEYHERRVDFFGEGPLRPRESRFCRYAGVVPYEDVPDLMATYEGFIHLPSWYEPFGRTVIEAWAAGCKLFVNNNIGAMWWLQNEIDAVRDGAGMFWKIVEEAVA